MALLLATWFGAGRLPLAPGTWGSAAALPLAFALTVAGGETLLALGALVIFLAGLWASDRVLRDGGQADPPHIVIDEVAGQLLALLPVAQELLLWPLAFLLFRAADIWKPWPVSLVEARLPGAAGVMSDDVVAALYAAVGLAALGWLLQRLPA